VVKVADLGLARLNSGDGSPAGGSSLTQAGGILGTADFMAPEQAVDSTSIDQRVDTYSLGCTLYFLLAGQPPFVANSLMALLLKHRDAPIPSLKTVRPEVITELDVIYMKMMAKKPEDRYASMTEVVKALEGVRAVVSPFDVRPGSKRTMAASESMMTDMTVAADSAEELLKKEDKPKQVVSIVASVPTPSEARRVIDLTVVLVEPSRTQASIVKKHFHDLGIDKLHAIGSGQQAIALAKQHKAHVLVSSMHLSDMTGLQLAQALSADPECGAIGFVLTSSESDTAEAAAILGTGRRVLLPKPFDLKMLARALAQAAGRAPEDVLPQ
jgi:serine/threonine protein kinase